MSQSGVGSQNIVCERPDGTAIGVLRITRPSTRNAVTLDMVEQFCQTLTELEQDHAVKAILLTGDGADLTVGLDIADATTMYRQADADESARIPSLRARLSVHDRYFWGRGGLYARVARCPKVTILAARGACFGVGLYLALCCDIVVAGRSSRFAQPRWRHLGADGDLTMLINAVGLKRAREMVFCGAEWDAAAAERYGLVDRVVADEEVEALAFGFGATVSGVVRDGIAAEKALALATLDKMQVSTGFAVATVMGAMASNIHFRPGEFNFLRELRDHGQAEARRRAQEYFGAPSEEIKRALPVTGEASA